MITTLKNCLYRAKKDYRDNGMDILLNSLNSDELTDRENNMLAKRKENGYKILKGEYYHYQVLVDGRDFSIVRISHDAMELLEKYDIHD